MWCLPPAQNGPHHDAYNVAVSFVAEIMVIEVVMVTYERSDA